MKIMKVLGVKVGPNCYNFCVESDELRIAQVESSLTNAAKEHKIQKKRNKKKILPLRRATLWCWHRRLMIKNF